MWKKAGLLSVSTLMALTLVNPVSADVVYNTDGMDFSKSISVKPSYELVVSDLVAGQDYTVTVHDNTESNKDFEKVEPGDSQQIGTLEIQGEAPQKYTATVDLTKAGRTKVKAETGGTDIQVVAAIDTGGKKITYGDAVGLNTNEVPTVNNVTVIASHYATKAQTVDSTMDAKQAIDAADTKQTKLQKAHPISKASQETLKQAHTQPQAGIDVNMKHFSAQKEHDDMIQDKKVRQQVQHDRQMTKVKLMMFRVLGIVILVLAGAGVGFGLMRLRRFLKQRGDK